LQNNVAAYSDYMQNELQIQISWQMFFVEFLFESYLGSELIDQVGTFIGGKKTSDTKIQVYLKETI
jgi:hypothetical protein